MYCASFYSDATIVAIEPLPPIAAVLRRNLSTIRKQCKWLLIIDAAIGGPDECGSEMDFLYFEKSPGESTRNVDEWKCQRKVLISAAEESDREEIKQIAATSACEEELSGSSMHRCKVISLEKVIRDAEVDKIDLLKVSTNTAYPLLFAVNRDLVAICEFYYVVYALLLFAHLYSIHMVGTIQYSRLDGCGGGRAESPSERRSHVANCAASRRRFALQI
jgi:hypothetical protein